MARRAQPAPRAPHAEKAVTAACESTVAPAAAVGEGTYLDFAHLKAQLPLARVLDQLGLSARLRGEGAQRRCACPIHRGDGRGRTFSVNLDENVFCCFEARCGQQGDVIDLWAAVRQLGLREAALDLVRTFGLEPAPARRTEKRHGERARFAVQPDNLPRSAGPLTLRAASIWRARKNPVITHDGA